MTHSMNTPSTSGRRCFATVARAARRAWRDCHGSMVIEFALLLPILLAVFFAIIQFGYIMYTRQEMLYAAREAARSYSVGLNDAAAARKLALTLLNPDNKKATVNFSVSVIEPSGSTTGGGGSGKKGSGKGSKKGTGGTTDTGVTGDVTVIITVPMAEAAIVSFLEKNILSGNIEVSATMFVQGVPEIIKGTSKSTGKATAKATGTGTGTGKGTKKGTGTGKATGDASFRDYVNGGNRFV